MALTACCMMHAFHRHPVASWVAIVLNQPARMLLAASCTLLMFVKTAARAAVPSLRPGQNLVPVQAHEMQATTPMNPYARAGPTAAMWRPS